MDMNNLRSIIRKYALENALKFNGKANQGSVISKVVGELPEAKSDMKTVAMETAKLIGEVNRMTLERIREEIETDFPEMLEKKPKEKKDDLKELEGAENGVIMRFAPSPSGPMHIGHAITGGLTSLYVRKYGGKFILRIEDTNSDNIDVDAYKMLPEDGEWIFGNVSEVWVQSERMHIYYDYAERFLKLGATYICTCSQEEFKKFADDTEDCPCRGLSVEENLIRWKKMFSEYKEGDAVMRFKSGMQDPNPAMRDFPLIRINDSEHPRQGKKYRVWPLMNMCVTVDDIEAGMTHIIRAKDHADNAKRQERMYKALGLGDKFPRTYFLGRYNFEGLEISCSKTRAKIKEGAYTGWDDIRVPFLRALKRKGYQPEAFLKYTRLTGLSLVDKTVPAEEFYKVINAFNKDIIDKTAKRLLFVHDYERIVIHGAPSQKLTMELHPEVDMGKKHISVDDAFFIQKSDLSELHDGELYRLMDCLNFRKENGKFSFDSLEHDKYKSHGKKIMHFVPANDFVHVEVLLDDASILTGVGESNIKNLKIGEVVQFERFGFCRLDSVSDGVYKFWFTQN